VLVDGPDLLRGEGCDPGVEVSVDLAVGLPPEAG
jgi:hypothetical protein